MKMYSKIAAFTLVMVGFAASVNAQNTAEANSTASATVIAPIAITNDGGLAFGYVIATLAGGTVTISEVDEERTASDNALLAPSDETSAATFTITGEADRNFSIQLPTTVNLVSGENTIEVNNFKSDLGTEAVVLARGSVALKVGADLIIAAGQEPGAYAGEFTVEVSYE